MKTTGLILTGGGARAAYQVGVLDAIARMQRAACNTPVNPFAVICGTSAGAINAAALACGADRFDQAVSELVSVWENFHIPQVYKTELSDMLTSGARWLAALLSLGWVSAHPGMRPHSLLDNTPLHDLLMQKVAMSRLPKLLDEGHLEALAITASNYSNGEHVTFFESRRTLTPWVRNQRIAQSVRLNTSHLLASAAIPFIFPAVALEGPNGLAYFGDGTMRQIAPIAPAIHLGAERVLVIGAGRSHESTATSTTTPSYPSMAQIAGHALSSIFLDALSVDLERMHRINQTLALIPPEKRQQSHLRHIDLLVIAPSQRLDVIATQHLDALPRTVRSLLRTLGASHHAPSTQSGALISYLLFENVYTQALMALGRADAQAQREEIHQFFNWPVPV